MGGAEENEKQPESTRKAKSTGRSFSQRIVLLIPLRMPCLRKLWCKELYAPGAA
jgi:hypothetical protein